MLKPMLRVVLGLALILGIALAGNVRAADIPVGPGETYTTIQSAADAALSGDRLLVAAGTYVEQVLVDGKDLEIVGAGAGLTIIQAPATLAVAYATSYDHYPVVGLQNGAYAVRDLTVDGAGMGNGHVRFMGIDLHNAAGAVTDVAITGVRDTPFSGVQHGVSLYLYNEDATARTVDIANVAIDDFQKNAMALFAAAGTPLTLSVTGCSMLGNGPTTVTAQNGIQVSGPDIVATVTGNTVTDVEWMGATWTSSGMMLFDCTGTVSGNTVTGCQTGVYLGAAAMTVSGNTIVVPNANGFGYGVTIDNWDPAYAKSAGADMPLVQPVDPELRAPRTAKATLASQATGNDVALDPASDDDVETYGVFAYNYAAYDDLDVTATGNTFTGLDYAVVVYDYAPTSAAFTNAQAGDNEFRACANGVYSNLPITVMAENCWWGAVDGPGGEGPGSGSTVTGLVDYDPWVTDYANLFCLPDPLDLTEAAPSGTVVFDYTGGASGRIYAYSIDVTWDPAVATALAGDFTRPVDGGFAGTEFFFVQDIAPGHVRIDAALGGAVPGVYEAPLFQGTFAIAAGAVEGAQTALTATVNYLRDNLNQPLAGVTADPGLIRVDAAGPVIESVLVTDTTLASTDWTRDTHTVEVTASVIEGDIAALTCDLTAFGGPVYELADATVAGNLYTWTFGPTAGTGDGAVTATVVCTDNLAQSATLADDIIADNTAPAVLDGLMVTPGHEQIHLAWTEPAADAGSPLQGVVFRYAAWGGYPHYAGLLPDPPADITAGDAAGAGAQPGAAWDWAVAPRDVYALAGFVVDFVGNASALGATGLATNYWLGDTDGDGYVTVVPDINALGDTYGLSDGDTGYNGVCDVGPTVDYSPRGVPDPQADGYQVQFEDLVLFALNFGEVDPALKFNPGATPDLRWERLDASTWALTLVSPCPGLKALNVQAGLPDGVTCQVSGGPLLAEQDAPVFLRNIPARGLDAGLAVIGFGEAITGSGELLRVTVNGDVGALAAKIDARDLNNGQVIVDMAQPTGADDLPTVRSLAQNTPNPFNPSTVIAFTLPRAERVHLAVYGLDGRLVRTLANDAFDAGRHEVTWRGDDDAGRPVATGTYFYAVRAGDWRQVRKMTLVK